MESLRPRGVETDDGRLCFITYGVRVKIKAILGRVGWGDGIYILVIHPHQNRTHCLYFGGGELIPAAPAPSKTEVAVDESKAKEFLNGPRRPKRQLWDRTRPETQQWYQQFLYRGFDEAVGAWARLPPGRRAGGRPWLRETGHRKLGVGIPFQKGKSP